jgi:hypothetical protein
MRKQQEILQPLNPSSKNKVMAAHPIRFGNRIKGFQQQRIYAYHERCVNRWYDRLSSLIDDMRML